MAKELPHPQILHKLLIADYESGRIFWRERDVSFFANAHSCKRWNTRWSGKEAFLTIGTHGYLRGHILESVVDAHRVLWAMAHGEWPKKQVDHINGDRKDNRLQNLRLVDPAENSRNMKKHKSNTSGFGGVSWCKRIDRWRAYVCVGSGDKLKFVNLGYHSCWWKAVSARQKYNLENGYTVRHGR